jgi:hypothetical protein
LTPGILPSALRASCAVRAAPAALLRAEAAAGHRSITESIAASAAPTEINATARATHVPAVVGATEVAMLSIDNDERTYPHRRWLRLLRAGARWLFGSPSAAVNGGRVSPPFAHPQGRRPGGRRCRGVFSLGDFSLDKHCATGAAPTATKRQDCRFAQRSCPKGEVHGMHRVHLARRAEGRMPGVKRSHRPAGMRDEHGYREWRRAGHGGRREAHMAICHIGRIDV